MPQPPYPPPGGSDPRGDRPGNPGRNPEGGPEDPTRRIDVPDAGGQREQTRQFPYGAPPYGGPGQYGSTPYGEPPQYGPTAYGQAPYGPPPYSEPGQAPYGPPPGPPPYGPPPYGQPWGPPGGEPPKKNRSTLIAVLVAVAVLLVAVVAVPFLVLRGSSPDAGDVATSATSTPTELPSGSASTSEPPAGDEPIPPATAPPDGLGDDPALDQLAQSCYDGDMEACDSLYAQSESGSLYELYGGTCAGRQGVSAVDSVFCTRAFPQN